MWTGLIYSMLGLLIINADKLVQNSIEEEDDYNIQIMKSDLFEDMGPPHITKLRNRVLKQRRDLKEFLQILRITDIEEMEMFKNKLFRIIETEMYLQVQEMMQKYTQLVDNEVIHYNFYMMVIALYITGIFVGVVVIHFSCLRR